MVPLSWAGSCHGVKNSSWRYKAGGVFGKVGCEKKLDAQNHGLKQGAKRVVFFGAMQTQLPWGRLTGIAVVFVGSFRCCSLLQAAMNSLVSA